MENAIVWKRHNKNKIENMVQKIQSESNSKRKSQHESKSIAVVLNHQSEAAADWQRRCHSEKSYKYK